MFAAVRQWIRFGRPVPGAAPGRAAARSAVGVEPLEGRALLSYFVIPKGHRILPISTGDARYGEPLHGNGLGVDRTPGFYPLYAGAKRPALEGVRAVAYVAHGNLVLSGTVAGPIRVRPTAADQGAIYSFGIDRGGASKRGPFPGREAVRFDAVAAVSIARAGTTATLTLNNPMTNQFLTMKGPLPASAVGVKGDVVTITVPLAMLPSTGHAINQWNVNFFTRDPAVKGYVRSVASLTPGATDFQVFVKQPTPH